MRVLFSIRPFLGHLHPIAPVARAVRDAGHEVAFATEVSFCSVVERCGFASFPAGLDPWAPAPWEGYEFAAVSTRSKAEGLLAIAELWPFDLIVRDPTDFGALIAAEALEVRHATAGFSRFCPTRWWRHVLGSSLDEVRSAFGLEPDPSLEQLYPWLYLDTVPPWFQDVDELPPGVVRRIRPEPYEAPPAPGAVCLDELPSLERPIVLVTLGTVFNRRPDLLARLCRGAVDAGAHVICAAGPGHAALDSIIDRTERVVVVEYVPLSDVLPHCAAVVAHGGYNTVMAALLHAVPLMLVPLGADNTINAKQCVKLGVGAMEPLETLTEARLTGTISRLLSEPRFRAAAARLAASTAELPHPREAAAHLEEMVIDPVTLSRRR
jgi:UDP:flavonoid glycosyltransferase YjiC (YdhE family)